MAKKAGQLGSKILLLVPLGILVVLLGYYDTRDIMSEWTLAGFFIILIGIVSLHLYKANQPYYELDQTNTLLRTVKLDLDNLDVSGILADFRRDMPISQNHPQQPALQRQVQAQPGTVPVQLQMSQAVNTDVRSAATGEVHGVLSPPVPSTQVKPLEPAGPPGPPRPMPLQTPTAPPQAPPPSTPRVAPPTVAPKPAAPEPMPQPVVQPPTPAPQAAPTSMAKVEAQTPEPVPKKPSSEKDGISILSEDDLEDDASYDDIIQMNY